MGSKVYPQVFHSLRYLVLAGFLSAIFCFPVFAMPTDLLSDTSIRAYYPLEDDTNDYSGNEASLTITGDGDPVFVNDGVFGGHSFHSTAGEYLSYLTDSPTFLDSDHFTVNAFAKRESGSSFSQFITAICANNTYARQFTLRYKTETNAGSSFPGTSVLNYDFYNPSLSFDTTDWNMYTLIKDGDTYSYYINAELATTTEDSFVFDTSTVYGWRLMGSCGSATDSVPARISSINGSIDEVSLFDRVLDQSELDRLLTNSELPRPAYLLFTSVQSSTSVSTTEYFISDWSLDLLNSFWQLIVFVVLVIVFLLLLWFVIWLFIA